MSLYINYIIESGISLALIYIFYELLLKRDTWFRFNRYYLLFGLFFSITLPLLDFSVTNNVLNSHNQFEFNEFVYVGNVVNSFKNNASESIPQYNYVFVIYLIVTCLLTVRIVYQLLKIVKIIKAYEIINYRNYKLVLIDKDSVPFSFFNYIFLSKNDYGVIGSNDLLLHEMIHAKQKHSFDIILLELILVLQWFNPFMYRYRLAFKEIHEYLADRGVIQKSKNKVAYQKLILSQIERSLHVNLASQFNYSLTKNRIKMMTRINSSKVAKFKVLLIVPLLLFLLSAFTVETVTEGIFNYNRMQTVEKLTDIPSIFPVKKVEGVKITSGFGMRVHPISKRKMMHNAVDIKAPEGTPVYATAGGMVRKVERNFQKGKGRGRYIIIDHREGFSTLYSQLSAYNVKEGDEVAQGDIIGYVGSSGLSTGPHLHYEIKKDGEYVDPEDYFNFN